MRPRAANVRAAAGQGDTMTKQRSRETGTAASHDRATRVVCGIEPEPVTPRQVKRAFLDMLRGGVELRCAGPGGDDPEALIARGFHPTHVVRLFDATYWISRLHRDDYFRYFVAYVSTHPDDPQVRACVFYKDTSLVWRSASHIIRNEDEEWIGKGAVKRVVEDGVECWSTAEETTNLPLEIQAALDTISRAFRTVPFDGTGAGDVLRNAPRGRIDPYRDFTAPRERAMARRADRVNGGAPVARFARASDPTSLEIAPGFEPDFKRGIVEEQRTASRLYGGEVRKYRVRSRNGEIQYQFLATPQHVWIIPPQAFTTEIMGYGLRTVDVEVPADLCIPGYEFHFRDESEDPPTLFSQIPEGFAGPTSEVDPTRASAGPWLERLPVIRRFRRDVPLPWKAPTLR